ncbi:putative bifunctional diguanylate cyclase/phosphodiesterase [Rhodobacter maris]|uniref:Periplasmic sensor diguanylate cyclase/phosphodiesterase n=1 Tax=Rhodobacter maris TaxID=446682 RepID=A0A285RQN0_9RHOB|nr:bifunctional diguanylate cyclase/phosphodiesterase [Rhodobacter maris]SOB94627.1 periplasmic sensor diguanylate cyclase/phosphodiesterase [Rhodobacter maris]
MKLNTLPSQIVVLVTSVLLAVLAVLWLSLLSVRHTMDVNAVEESTKRVMGRLRSMQEEVSLIASDYHNWTDLYLDAKSLAIDQLASNYGITAERGDVFQYAEIFDGPFAAPLSWQSGAGLAPQSGFLRPSTLEVLRAVVPGLDSAHRETYDFFGMRDGRPVMFSSSYLLPENAGLLAQVDRKTVAIATIGKLLEASRLQDMERELSIAGLEVLTEQPPAGSVSIPLTGVNGDPVGWLSWTPPKPGTLLFWKMFPIMGGISIVFVLISYSSALLLRSKAEGLIEREAISFSRARIDALTQLPNRYAMREHLERLHAEGDLHCAVITIDLVRFKTINDTVGHLGGDAFLVEFASRLHAMMDDTTFVSRYGGDEFFVVIACAEGLEETVDRKCRELEALSTEPIICDGVSFEVQASKGLAFDEDRTLDHEELLRRADRAMYSAKLSETLDVVRYDKRMEIEDLDHKRIERELRRALADGTGFEMYYQPIVPVGSVTQPVRYEALARWVSPEMGRIAPDRFIKVAEASGLIMPLGWVLLDLVCKDMQRFEGARININVSPMQLMSNGFSQKFTEMVLTHGIEPGQIEVEVTEQIVLRDDATISQELIALSANGFTLALDDFGTGFASIGYLMRIPFDTLKIDRSFVRSIEGGQHGLRMIRSIIGLARAMELTIVAEGVETELDATRLAMAGADFLQGYHFGRPEPLDTHLQKRDPSARASAI